MSFPVMDGILISKDRLCIDEECIGSGGYGKVYPAVLKPEERKVAFKQLLANVDNRRQKQRLIKEVEQLHKLRHDNIIKVVGVLESDRFGLVMDYADFGCLLDLQEDYAPLSWLMKADLLHGVADGMVYLHAQGILHQDLKASNVLVDEALQPKISDFGVSHWREAMKQSSQSQSSASTTVTHIAPEHLADVNFQPNAKCDVYSFAILMFEVLSDKIPFFGVPGDRIEKAVKSGERPDVRQITIDCPQKLLAIMMRCWHHEPDGRPDFIAVRESLVEHMSEVEGFQAQLEQDKYRILVKSGFRSACTPPPSHAINALNRETRRPRIEMDSLPVNINDNTNPGDTSPSTSDRCTRTNISEEGAAKPANPGAKQMPDADVWSGLKDLKINPDMISGQGVKGGYVQVGNNNFMNINLDNKSRGKKVITVKMSDLTTCNDIACVEACDYVSKHTGKKWRDVGRFLKFSDGELDAFGSDYRDDMKETIHQMLRQWLKRDGKKATLHNLAVALAKGGKADVALEMKKFAPYGK